jgi:hypothetical protein
MSAAIDSLILDFLEWLAPQPRPYVEVMAAWRTSCPRLTVWEDVIEAGYVARDDHSGGEPMVHVTARGLTLLAAHDREIKPAR